MTVELRGGPPLVGREGELVVLRSQLDAAARGAARPVLVAGEPGIGKSRLVEAAAHEARAAGIRVVWGRCWESGGTPAYWPWIQALRSLLADDVAMALTERMGWTASGPAGEGGRGSAHLSAVSDDGGARFRLFHDVATALVDTTTDVPALVVLEDLHVADHPSLLLADFVLSHLGGGGSLAVVGTYREIDARLAGTGELLGRLARQGTLLRLDGLDERAIAAVLEGLLPSADVDTAREVREASGGNPLFTIELARLLALGTADLPDSVRATLRRRVELLDPADCEVLGAAAVLGRPFEPGAVASLAEVTAAEVHRAMTAGEALAVLMPAGAGGWSFVHDLFRQAAADLLGPDRVAQLHRRAADHLAATGAAPTEVAHHAWKGGSDDVAQRCQEAGDHALAALAYEEASTLYERALASLPADAVDERLDVLDRLGTAAHRRGDHGDRRRHHQAAAALARRHRRVEALARAAIGVAPYCESHHDPVRIDLLEEAAGALSTTDSPLRALVLALLAENLFVASHLGGADRVEDALRLLDEAVAMAERLGEPEVLVAVLRERHIVDARRAKPPADRLPTAQRALDAALRVGEPGEIVVARCWLAHDLLGTGAVAEAELEIARADELAVSIQEPFAMWAATMPRPPLALVRGDLDEAERLADEAFAHGERTGFQDVFAVDATFRFFLHRARGRLRELPPPRRVARSAAGASVLERLHQALGMAELGLDEDARWLLTSVAGGPWSVQSAAMWAETAFLLDEAAHADALYAALQSHVREWVTMGGIFMSTNGSLHRHLGLLAGLQGDTALACRHLDEARSLHEAEQLHVLVAEGDWAQGKVLLAAGRPNDARPFLDRACRAFERFGMPAHLARVEALLAAAGPAAGTATAAVLAVTAPPGAGIPAATAPAPAREELRAGLVRRGRDWTVRFGERERHIRHAVGLEHLARLVAAPGSELHCLDLAAGPAAAVTARAVGASGTGPALDDRAKAEYRRRIEELEAELDEAATHNDTGRVEHLELELEALLAELRGAVGLGGRDRETGSHAERARISVTKALRRAIDRIHEADPDLGAHLRATIRTGTYCSYQPDPLVTLRWET